MKTLSTYAIAALSAAMLFALALISCGEGQVEGFDSGNSDQIGQQIYGSGGDQLVGKITECLAKDPETLPEGDPCEFVLKQPEPEPEPSSASSEPPTDVPCTDPDDEACLLGNSSSSGIPAGSSSSQKTSSSSQGGSSSSTVQSSSSAGGGGGGANELTDISSEKKVDVGKSYTYKGTACDYGALVCPCSGSGGSCTSTGCSIKVDGKEASGANNNSPGCVFGKLENGSVIEVISSEGSQVGIICSGSWNSTKCD